MTEPHERLRGARLAAGFETSRAAAKAMGISEFTYNAHENGTRGIKPDSAARYARKFKVPAEWILFGKGAPGSTEPEPQAEIINIWDRMPEDRRALAIDILTRLADGPH